MTFLLIYLVISALEVIFLLMGGLGLFESICITFGTVATGGFSLRNNSLAEFSPYPAVCGGNISCFFQPQISFSIIF